MDALNIQQQISIIPPSAIIIPDDDGFEFLPSSSVWTPTPQNNSGINHFSHSSAALVAQGWSVYPQERDSKRKPGTVKGTVVQWKNEHELHLKLPTQAALQDWNAYCPSLNAAAVLGAGSGNAFALDIDVLDPAMSSAIEAIALKILGDTPLRRVGMAPKIAMIYRHSADDTLFYSRRIFQQSQADGATNGLEILCGGRPLTFVGLHWKTGGYFKWTQKSPLQVGPDAAPLVSSAQVEEFLAAVNEAFPFTAGPAPRTYGQTSGGTWGVASEDVVVPHHHEGDKLSHGREGALLSYAAKIAIANGAAIMQAEEAGIAREITQHLAEICEIEFSKFAVVNDNKWTPVRLRTECYNKVASAVKKVISGFFTPTAMEVVEPRVPSVPEVRLADLPVNADTQVILIGVGENWSSDGVTIFVNHADGSSKEYPCDKFRPEIDQVARDQAKIAEAQARRDRRNEKRAAAKANMPTVRIEVGRISDVIDAAEKAVIAADYGLYQRGGSIVAVGMQPIKTSEGLIMGMQVIEQGDYAILEAMTACAIFEKHDGRKDSFVRCDLPISVARTYQQRKGRWKLPYLAGFANAPTLRADGSIMDVEGYDEDSNLLVDFGGVAFPSIPEKPTKEDALKALAILKKLVSTFPFVSETHRAVALSCLLTASIRRSLAFAPIHAFTAPVAGSGKSKLANIASIIACGREAEAIGQSKSEEEFEKRLGAVLLAGEAVIAIDNVSGPVGGDFLCSVMTSQYVKPRILGKSEMPSVSTDALLIVNGNNIKWGADMDRRALLSRLDPCVERPQLLEFANNPVADAKAMRPDLVVAALTVLRAYKVAGRAAKVAPLGSFEEWSMWVREALIWLGEADPVDMVEASSLDVERDTTSTVLIQWNLAIGGQRVAARDIINAAAEMEECANGYRGEFKRPDFREALLAVAGEGGAVNSRRLGKFLASHADRIIDGLQIKKAGVSAGVQLWQMVTI